MIDTTLMLKFAIAIIWDILDFAVLHTPPLPPFLGTITDFISIPLAIALWGEEGLLASWELLDPTEIVDSFVPTLTIIGLIQYVNKGDIETITKIATRPKHA